MQHDLCKLFNDPINKCHSVLDAESNPNYRFLLSQE